MAARSCVALHFWSSLLSNYALPASPAVRVRMLAVVRCGGAPHALLARACMSASLLQASERYAHVLLPRSARLESLALFDSVAVLHLT
eukprot:5128964-Pleurochrysis_carterae.AAC.1